MWWCGRACLSDFRKEVMGARLLLAEGRVQKSPEGVVHLMAERLMDRSADLRLLVRRRRSAPCRPDRAIPAMSASCRHHAIFTESQI